MIDYKYLYDKHKNSTIKIVCEVDENGDIKEYEYKDILSRVEKVSELLSKNGIDKNDSCIICGEDGCDFTVYYLALFKLNATAILIDKTITAQELQKITSDISASVVITDEKHLKLFDDKFNIVVDMQKDSLKVNNDIERTKNENDYAKTIIFSSGTTSTKSGVIHKTSNIYEMIKYTNERFNVSSDDTFITIIPNTHIYGLCVNIIFNTFIGTRVYYLKSLDAKILFQILKDINIIYFVGVSKIYELFEMQIKSRLNSMHLFIVNILFKIRKFFNINLGKIIFKDVFKIFGHICFISAGSALNNRTKNFLFGIGFPMIEFYGSTETGVPVITTVNKNKYTYGTGRVMIPCEIKIKETTGELLVHNDYRLIGYAGNENKIKEILDDDGWINTGDIAKIINKNVYITGRTKEVIVLSNGEKHSPDDIEALFKGIAQIKDYCICGIPSQQNKSCDDIHLFVVLKKQEYESEVKKQIRKISESLGTNIRIQQIHFIDEIPRTSIGKAKRYLLKKQVCE